MRKILLSMLTIVLTMVPLIASEKYIWSQTYGTDRDDVPCQIRQVEDGFIMVGYDRTAGAGYYNAHIEKISTDGDTLWSKSIGGDKSDEAKDIIEVSDGYLVVGETKSYTTGGKDDLWIIKLDSNGDTLWTKVYGGSGNESVASVVEAQNGYILTGSTSSYGNGGSDLWIVKFNGDGDTLWTKTYGDTAGNNADHIIPVNSGDGYLILGATYPIGENRSDYWLLRIDEPGDTLWTKTYGGAGGDSPWAITSTNNDDGYILCGYSDSFNENSDDAWIVKIDESGDTLWTNTFDYFGDDWIRDICKADKGYILVGTTDSKSGGLNDVLVVKIDESGDTVWTKTFGGSDWDGGFAVTPADGDYIIAAETDSYGSYGSVNFWAIKINENGDGVGVLEKHSLVSNSSYTFSSKERVNIFNSRGQLIGEFNYSDVDIMLPKLSEGFYFIQSIKNDVVVKRIIQ